MVSYKLFIIFLLSLNGVLLSIDLKRNMLGICINSILSLFKIKNKIIDFRVVIIY